MLKAKCRGAHRVAVSGPNLGEAQGVGPQFLDFVDQKLAAWLIAIEADQSVLAIDEDHVVAQVADVLGRLLRCSAMAEHRQQVEQLWVALAQRSGVAQRDAQPATLLDHAL